MPREIANIAEEQSSHDESSSVWQQISDELHIKERLAGDTGDKKLARVAYVTGKGLYEGATGQIANIIEHPTEALKGVGIGTATIGLMIATKGSAFSKLLPTAFAGSAALNVMPHLGDVSSAYQSAWASNKYLDQNGARLTPLGAMAVDYGIAKITFAGLNRGLGAWAENVGKTGYRGAPKEIPGALRNDSANPQLLAEIRSSAATGRAGSVDTMRGKPSLEGLQSGGRPIAAPEGLKGAKGPERLTTHDQVMEAADRAHARLEQFRPAAAAAAPKVSEVTNSPFSVPKSTEVAQNRPAAGASAAAKDAGSGLPKLRSLEDTKPISDTDAFPTQFPSPYSWPNFVRDV